MKRILFFLLALFICDPGFSQESDSRDLPAADDRLANIHERFPQSDANEDGTLTRLEAAAFFCKRREGMERPKATPGEKRRGAVEPNHADVPVYMIYSRPDTTVTVETGSSEWVHHVKLGLKLQEAVAELGLECIVTGPDVIPENDPYGSLEAFLIAKLKG